MKTEMTRGDWQAVEQGDSHAAQWPLRNAGSVPAEALPGGCPVWTVWHDGTRSVWMKGDRCNRGHATLAEFNAAARAKYGTTFHAPFEHVFYFKRGFVRRFVNCIKTREARALPNRHARRHLGLPTPPRTFENEA